MKLRRDYSIGTFMQACYALEVAPLRALRDPAGIVPFVASASLEGGTRFLALVLREPVSLEAVARSDGEDAALLLLTGVWARYVSHVRSEYRHHRTPHDLSGTHPDERRRAAIERAQSAEA